MFAFNLNSTQLILNGVQVGNKAGASLTNWELGGGGGAVAAQHTAAFVLANMDTSLKKVLLGDVNDNYSHL